RYPEADLPAVDDVGGEVLARHLLHDPLRRARAELEPRGDAEGEFDQVVVEEGGTILDRGRHRHAIAALEQVVDEPGVAVDVEHPLQKIPRGAGPDPGG